MHIAITGNIGAGKTTLTRMLGEHYNWQVLYESVDDNPYLTDFYKDMKRWAFNLQVYFINNRFKQIQKIHSLTYTTVVQDRTIYEDAFVFARNLFESGILEERDYRSYKMLFDSIVKSVPPPDLMIYLKADVPKLKKQITRRGREFEAAIPDEYLVNLNRYYEEFVRNYDQGKLITIDVNQMDFAADSSDFLKIREMLDKELFY